MRDQQPVVWALAECTGLRQVRLLLWGCVGASLRAAETQRALADAPAAGVASALPAPREPCAPPPMRRGLQVPAPRGPVVLVLRSLTPPQVRGGAMTWDAVSPRGRSPPRLPGATCCCRFHSANRRGRLPGIFLRLVISAMEDAAGLRSHDRNAARLFSWGGREPRKEGDECGIKATASGEGAAARGSTPVN